MSANEASNVIVCYEQIIILLGKISSHADLCFAADTSNPEFAQHSQNMREAINAVQSNLVFIELELASISEVQYLQMLKEEAFAHYQPCLLYTSPSPRD